MSENSGTPDLSPIQQALAAQAEQALLRSRHQLSNHFSQPFLLWSAEPMDQAAISEAVEARGYNPYRLICGWPEPRGLQVPGRPAWARHCYLVVVEILARVVT